MCAFEDRNIVTLLSKSNAYAETSDAGADYDDVELGSCGSGHGGSLRSV